MSVVQHLKKLLLLSESNPKRQLLLKALAVVVGIAGVRKLITIISDWIKSYSYLRKAQRVQKAKISKAVKEIEQFLVDYSQHLPTEEQEKAILDSDVVGLIEMLDAQRTSSVQLLLVFLRRCITVGLKLGAITDFNHIQAMHLAEECDRKRPTLEKPLPALYGIPISIKNNFMLKGFDSSMGLIARFGQLDSEDGLVVEVLKESLGAIPFIKSTTPTGIVGTESMNYVHGHCLNPYNLKRSPGGSSSGEGALVASGCSPLGIGTDAAGSIRTPALFCGLYGYMISPTRVTEKGTGGVSIGTQEHVKVYIGPMARSVRDIRLVVSSLVSDKTMAEKDFYLQHIPWNPNKASPKKKYRIATFPKNPLHELGPTQKRVYENVVSALKDQGHEIVEWTFPHNYELVHHFLRVANYMMTSFIHHFKYDFVGGESMAMRNYEAVPNWLKNTAHFFMQRFGPSPRLRLLSKIVQRGSMEDFFDEYEQMQVWANDVQLELRNKKIDAILIPGIPPAYRLGTAHLMSNCHSAHIFPNAARLCAGIVPIGFVREGEDNYTDSNKDFLTSLMNKNNSGSVGLPIGVQVAANRNDDETCLAVMELIESIFQFKNIQTDV